MTPHERAKRAAVEAAHWSMHAHSRTTLNEVDREAGAIEYARIMGQYDTQEEAA